MASPLRFFTPRSIGQRFALAIGMGAGMILIVLAVANYLSGRELLLEQTSREALNDVQGAMLRMDDQVDRVAMLTAVIGETETSGGKKNGVTVPWLASLLEYCPIHAVYGLYMTRDDKDWRDPAENIWVDRRSWPNAPLATSNFHAPSQEWYRGAREQKGLYVTQPYFDSSGSGIDMISITQPVYTRQGDFLGVAGVDLSLEEIRSVVRKLQIRDFEINFLGSEGKVTSITELVKQAPKSLQTTAFLITRRGSVIVGPAGVPDRHAPLPGEKNPEAVMGNLQSYGLVTNPEDIQEILLNSSGCLRLKDGSRPLIYWAEGRVTKWKLVLEVPYQLIVAPARHLAIQSVIIGGGGLILLLGVVFFTARRVSGPIRELQSVASNFEKGSYEENNEVLGRIGKRHDELGDFAGSFSIMAREIALREERLSEWSSHLEATVEERTADLARAMHEVKKTNQVMAAELAQAAAYSRAVLPEKLQGEVTTDWIFETSTQLGGDSFGYHWIDDDHLAIYLLDVCGHGVGAALLSVSVVNLLRTSSLTETDFLDPSAVLSRLNATFPMEQHNDMYFTAWYGVYSRSSHQLRYACAGHPPAVLITRDGATTLLRANGLVVGAFPVAAYETKSVTVPEGSRLYLFSDGVYEIDRPKKPMMTYQELVILLSGVTPGHLDFLVDEIRRQQGGGSFADDFSLVEFLFES